MDGLTRYVIYTRAHNIGGGWRRFGPVWADNPLEACKTMEHREERIYVHPHEDGSKARPVLLGGVCDVAAEEMRIEADPVWRDYA